MSSQRNVTLWARPAWSADRFVRDFFGPAPASDWFKPLPTALHPAAEIARDGDDAVVRLELPGVDGFCIQALGRDRTRAAEADEGG